MYPVELSVSLVDYPEVPSLVTSFTVSIELLVYNLPYFETALDPASVQMTNLPQTWSFPLPRLLDNDGDSVTLSTNFAGAASFCHLETTQSGMSIVIDDISPSGGTLPGFYLITFTLSDGTDSVVVPFSLLVFPPPVIEQVPVETLPGATGLEGNSTDAWQSESQGGTSSDP